MGFDYSSLGLTPLLNSKTALTERGDTMVSAFTFDSEYERGVIDSVHIKDAAIDSAKIGTATIQTANIADAAVTNAKIDSLSAGKLTAGTITVLASLGTGNVKLDGANKRIVINDGTNDRIIIGYQANGF